MSEEKALKENTYIVKGKCENCGVMRIVSIPRGTLMEDYLRIAACEHCGCRGIGVMGLFT